jgi:hypothetical protein
MTNVYAQLTEDRDAVNVYNGGSLKDTYTLKLLGLKLGVDPSTAKASALTEYYTRMSSQRNLHLSSVWG